MRLGRRSGGRQFAAAGLARLTTNASRVARPFFQRRGFTLLAAQTVVRRGIRLENFRMEKVLAG